MLVARQILEIAVVFVALLLEEIERGVLGEDEIRPVGKIVKARGELQIDVFSDRIQHVFEIGAEPGIVAGGQAHVVEGENLEAGDQVAVGVLGIVGRSPHAEGELQEVVEDEDNKEGLTLLSG